MNVLYEMDFDSEGNVYYQTLRMNRSELVDWNSKIWDERMCNFPNKQHYIHISGYQQYLNLLPQDRDITHIYLNITQLRFIRLFANNTRIFDRPTKIVII